MLDILNHDAWAAVSQYLDPISVSSLASTCMGLNRDISSNSALWRGQAQKRWPALFAYSSVNTISNWHEAYRAAHKAACELATHQPWTDSVSNITSCCTPRSAHVLLSNTLHQAPGRPTRSSSSSSTGPAALNWHSSTCVAAAFGSQLHFWRWSAQADLDPPFVGQLPGPPDSTCSPAPHSSSSSGGSSGTILPAAEIAAGAGAWHCWHWCSDGCHSNSTGPISVLVEVPTGDVFPGFASGSVDGTVKLWTPFSTITSSSSSNSSAGRPVRPCRTLTGHTDQITAMACLTIPPPGRAPQSTTLTSSSSRSSSSAGVPILVSGSADKTIKLWSLASIQQPSSAVSTTTTSSSSSSGGTGGLNIRQGGKQQQQQQQGRNVLLGTLRGHSGAISALLPWPAESASGSSICGSSSTSSGGGGSCILSGSRDSRVKLWDVSEGRRSCAATWRLAGPCRQLLGGLDMPGCPVVLLERSLQVLDLRVPSAGSAVTQGVLTLPWGAKGIATVAARGSVIAVGGRDGVRAWDVRMAHSNAAAATTTTSSSRLLVSGCLPNKAHVSHLHLDSLKLVAACNRPKLHSAAGIAAWSLATGNRVELPSSCLSGINLHPTFHPYKAASKALGSNFSDAHTAVQHLMDQLSDREGEQAVAIRAGELGSSGSDTDSAASDSLGFVAFDSSSDLGLGGGSVGAVVGGFDGASSDESGGYSSSDSESEDGSSNAVHAIRTAGYRGRGVAGNGSGSWGCIEPGVLAMAVQGPVVACIDSVGNFLLRDFTAGEPGSGLIQSFATAPAGSHAVVGGECAGGLSVSAMQLRAAGSGIASTANGGLDGGETGSGGGKSEQQGRQAANGERCSAEADACSAAEQVSKLKFWRQ